MKTDRKLLAAVIILIGLVAWLLLLSINRGQETKDLKQAIAELKDQKIAEPKVINGKTPILGVDYFNGQNPTDTQIQKAVDNYMSTHPLKDGQNGLIGSTGLNTYDLAVISGFPGTLQEWLYSLKVKGDKGDPAPELDISCIDGVQAKKYGTDAFWQKTNIKCETTDE